MILEKIGMNRLITVLVAASLTAGIFAQGAFTIRRPANGSTVREVVKVRIPSTSIPQGGYVGFTVNGKFIEATVPVGDTDIQDGMWVYQLDTKARGIPDGNLKIEAVLYAPFGSGARIANRSSVTVKLDNRTSIKPPAGGFKLRYNFKEGSEYIYRIEERVGRSQITEAQAQLGGRAAELSNDPEIFRYLIAFDKRYNGGAEGLVRLQPFTLNGKDHVTVSTVADPIPRRFEKDTLHPIYMRLTNTGREIFGRAPFYTGFEGNSGKQSLLDLFATIPLPILPTKGVTVGSIWDAGMVASSLADISKIYDTDKMTAPSRARGTLEAIEWQNNERCAKIHNKIQLGTAKDGATSEQEEFFWISLDRGVLLKLERNYVRTVRIKDVQNSGATAGTDGGTPGGKARPGAQGAGGGSGAATGAKIQGKGGPSRPGGDGGGPRRPGGTGLGGNAGGRSGGSSSGVKIVRERVQITMTLDASL